MVMAKSFPSLLLLLSLGGSGGSSQTATFAPCAPFSNGQTQPMNITTVTLAESSSSSTARSAVSLSFNGLANEDVSGGRVSTTIYPFNVPVVDPNYPLDGKIYLMYNTYGSENK